MNAVSRLLSLVVICLLGACGDQGDSSARSYEQRVVLATQAIGVGDWVLEKTICSNSGLACNIKTLQYDPETDSVVAFVSSGIAWGADTLGGFSVTGIAPVVPETRTSVGPYSADGRFISYARRNQFDWVSGQLLPNPYESFTYTGITPSGASIGYSFATGSHHLITDYGSRSRTYNGTITNLDGTAFDPNIYSQSHNEWLCVIENDSEYRVLIQRSTSGESGTSASDRVNLFELTFGKNGVDNYSLLATDQPKYLERQDCANTVRGALYVLKGESDIQIYNDGVLKTGTEIGLPVESIIRYRDSIHPLPYGQSNRLGFLVKDFFVMGNTLVGVPSFTARVATDLVRLYSLTIDPNGRVDVWSARINY